MRSADSPPLGIHSRLAHAGQARRDGHALAWPHVIPIHQTSAFEYASAEAAEAAARGELPLYTRTGNPTEEALAAVVAELEGAEAALTFASGMGAMAAALETLLGRGDVLVTVAGLYGGTHELCVEVLPRLGVEVVFVEAPTAAALATALDAAGTRARVALVESISNPLLRVADVGGIAAACAARGVALVVDATFATPLGQRPLALGATLSVHSATKYLSGHGDVLGGVVSGARGVVDRVRLLRKLHGACIDPFAAWLVLRGLRTLALRLERQDATATALAARLGEVPGVVRVHHPSRADHADHALVGTAIASGGAMLSFEVAGGLDGARRVYDRLRLISRAASLGDLTSLMTHPARFSHLHVDAETRRRAGIVDGLLRLSVGIEDEADLLADLTQALS